MFFTSVNYSSIIRAAVIILLTSINSKLAIMEEERQSRMVTREYDKFQKGGESKANQRFTNKLYTEESTATIPFD